MIKGISDSWRKKRSGGRREIIGGSASVLEKTLQPPALPKLPYIWD